MQDDKCICDVYDLIDKDVWGTIYDGRQAEIPAGEIFDKKGEDDIFCAD